MNKSLNRLIGIPWGSGPGTCDCLRLMRRAERVLLGVQIPRKWHYDADSLMETSKIALREIQKYCVRVEHPCCGIIGLIKFDEFYHFVTFVDELYFLHVPRGGESRLTRYSLPYKRLTTGLFNISEEMMSKWRP